MRKILFFQVFVFLLILNVESGIFAQSPSQVDTSAITNEATPITDYQTIGQLPLILGTNSDNKTNFEIDSSFLNILNPDEIDTTGEIAKNG